MRDLTFLDPDDERDSADNETDGFMVAHSILAAACLISVIQGIYETRRKHYLYERSSLRYLFPWASFVQMLENASLAYDVSYRKGTAGAWSFFLYALHSTVSPCLLLSTFDVTYSIHKTRHIPFCGVYDGETQTENPNCTFALKFFMRALAVCLIAINVIVDYNLLVPESPYAGRVGWYWLISEPWEDSHIQVIMGLIPIAVLAIASFYFSIVLWIYGTSYSMVVHASPFNPWFSPFFGTVGLAGGQMFGPKWFPLLSNLATFVFVESIILLFMEVNKDMQATKDLRDFLDALGGKRSEIVARARSRRRQDTETPREQELAPLQNDEVVGAMGYQRGQNTAIEEGAKANEGQP